MVSEHLISLLPLPLLIFTGIRSIAVWEPKVYKDWVEGTPAERKTISARELKENPHIAAYHFYRPFLTFMDEVVAPKFDVTDWWNRYEFQARNSSHNHEFLWLKDFVKWAIDNINSEEERQKFADYWGLHLSGLLPINVPLEINYEERTLMSIPPEDEENSMLRLANFVNRLQRNKCTPYCQRVKKGDKSANPLKYCRFWSPWITQKEPSVDKNKNPAHYMFSPARNDIVMGTYQRLVTMTWKVNTGFSPSTSTYVALNYLAKYFAKEEVKSKTYLDLVREVLPFLNTAKPLFSLVAKMINKLVGERDWSSQEVMHILLDIPLQPGSRDVQSRQDARPQLSCFPDHDRRSPRRAACSSDDVVFLSERPVSKKSRSQAQRS